MFNRNENQPTKQEKAKEIVEQKMLERENEVLKDDRIQQKIQEYEEKKQNVNVRLKKKNPSY